MPHTVLHTHANSSCCFIPTTPASLSRTKSLTMALSWLKRTSTTCYAVAKIGIEPFRVVAVIITHASPHAILEITDNSPHLAWYAKACMSASHSSSRSTESYAFFRWTKRSYRGVFLCPPSYSNQCTTNNISIVDRAGRKPHCSSASNPSVSQELLRRGSTIVNTLLTAWATREIHVIASCRRSRTCRQPSTQP